MGLGNKCALLMPIKQTNPQARHPLAHPKTPPTRPQVGYPALYFAQKFDMLTDQEIEACLKGDMHIESNELLNLNVNFQACGIRPGEKVRLYQGRRTQLLIDQLLDPNQDS